MEPTGELGEAHALVWPTMDEIDTLLSSYYEEECMPVHKCPTCRVTSNFTPHANKTDARRNANLVIETCQSCDSVSFFEYEQGTTPARVTFVYPSVEDDVDESLPDKVKIALGEAYKAMENQIWNACVLMSRRAIEEAVKELGAEGRDLKAKIEDLATKQQLMPDLKEWAHEGRLGGNLGAHGSKDQDFAEKEDAEEILEFTRWFLRYAFVLPKQLSDRRANIAP